MIERLIIKALRAGIADFQAEPQRIDAFCIDQLGLSSAEGDKVREIFLAKPPNVIHQYPRQDSKFPLYAVVLGSDRESLKALGDFGGFVGDRAGVGSLELLGMNSVSPDTMFSSSIFDYVHHVMVYSDHPDVTIYYYELAKHILIRERDFFKAAGILDMALRGQDLGPNEAYTPEYLFTRKLEMLSKQEYRVFGARGVIINRIEGTLIVGGENVCLDDPQVLADITTYVQTIGSDDAP